MWVNGWKQSYYFTLNPVAALELVCLSAKSTNQPVATAWPESTELQSHSEATLVLLWTTLVSVSMSSHNGQQPSMRDQWKESWTAEFRETWPCSHPDQPESSGSLWMTPGILQLFSGAFHVMDSFTKESPSLFHWQIDQSVHKSHCSQVGVRRLHLLPSCNPCENLWTKLVSYIALQVFISKAGCIASYFENNPGFCQTLKEKKDPSFINLLIQTLLLRCWKNH